MRETSELWWVSVGGNNCEPARIVKTIPGESAKGNYQLSDHKEKIEVYTIGCSDGTVLTPDSGIKLVAKVENTFGVPLTEKQQARQAAAWEKKRAEDTARGIRHSYRRFP